MRTLVFFCLLAAGLPACKKHSAFTGRVTSSADGAPVENAEVQLHFYRYPSGGGTETVVYQIVNTNARGEYAVELDATTRAESGSLQVLPLQGFAAPVPVFIDPGDCDEVDFVLNPLDAWLSVTFKNDSSNTFNYYTSFNSTYPGGDHRCPDMGCGPHVLASNQTKTHIGQVPGGADVKLGWTLTSVWPNQSDSKNVFCPRNDTTYVTITL